MMFIPSWLQWGNAMLIFSFDILISQATIDPSNSAINFYLSNNKKKIHILFTLLAFTITKGKAYTNPQMDSETKESKM